MKINLTLKIWGLAVTLLALTGCSSVPMAPKEQDAASKTFKTSSPNLAGIYIYRNSFMGQALKKDLSVDGVKIGTTSNKVYFHKELTPGPHTVSTESEFGDNALTFMAESGKNYYFRQYIKLGLLLGGSGIESVTETDGREAVLECDEAK